MFSGNGITAITDDSPLVDTFCRSLAQFVRDRLNEMYTARTIVSTVRDYDDYDVPIHEYPLLKVFRTGGYGTIGDSVNTSRIRLSYLIKWADHPELPGLWHWLDRVVPILISEYRVNHSGCPTLIEAGQDIQINHSPRQEFIAGRGELVYRSDFDFQVKE